MRTRLLRYIGAGFGLLLLAGGAAIVGLGLKTRDGKSFLADFVSRSASSAQMKVDIGEIDGLFSTHPGLRNIALADPRGVWLKIDRVDLDWSPLALAALRLDVNSLKIGRIEALRRPDAGANDQKPAETKPAEKKSAASWPPDLPIRVRLGLFEIGALTLDAPVIGAPASFGVNGSAEAGASSDGARASFSILRQDAPGEVKLEARIAPGGNMGIDFSASEPAGGVIARIAQLPGAPPLAVTLKGEGPLDDFRARLDASAGSELKARGEAGLSRNGAGRRLDFDLTSDFSVVLSKALADIFAGDNQLKGVADFADDGGVVLERLALVNRALTLEASGRLGADRTIDAHVALHGQASGATGAFRAKTLEGEVAATGSIDKPDARLSLLIEDMVSSAGRIGHFDAAAKAVAEAPLSEAGSHVDVNVEAHGEELALAGRGVSEALGDRLKLSLRARATADGDADIGLAKIEAGGANLTYAGKAGPGLLDGKLVVGASDLSRFSGIAGRSLHGAMTLAASLSGAPREGRIGAALNGTITEPGAGVAAVDGLLGKKLAIGGKVETLPGGGVNFDALTLNGEFVQARLNGTATKAKANIAADVALPDLRRADPRLSGRAALKADLSGSLEKPDAKLRLNLADAAANGRAIPKLELDAQAQDITGALKAAATLGGTIDGRPARGELKVSRAGEAWKLENIDLGIGRATLKGSMVYDGAARGRMSLNAPDLDDFSALALQKLAGALNAEIALDAASGGQDAAIDLKGSGLRAHDLSLARIDAKLSARDVLRRPALQGEASLEKAEVGKETIASARLKARPAGAGTALDLDVNARGFNILGAATVTPGEKTRLDLASLVVQRGGKKLSLAGPAAITLGEDGEAEIRGLAINADGGRLDLDGRAGERLDLTLKARSVPLSIAALADPSLSFDGKLDAEARVTGSKAAPGGDWKVTVSKFSAPQLKNSGLPAIDVAAQGRISGKRTSVDADIAMGTTNRVKITGSAPLDAKGALDIAIKGGLDAGIANTMLSAGGQTVHGKAALDLRIAGQASSPIVDGAMTLSEGSFADPANGVAFDKIGARLEARGREINLASLQASTHNGGQISGSGRISILPEAGMPGSLRIIGRNALLVSSALVSSTADFDLNLGGPLARAPKVTGVVKFNTLEVNVPDRLPSSLRPLPDTVHKDARGFAKELLELQRKQKAKAGKPSAFDAALDLNISAPNRIFVRGRGIDAEFGGELKIAGTVQKPNVIGGFDLRRGKLQLLTQRIDITRGKLSFSGGLMPELDFYAEATAGDVTAQITISGPASQPSFAFSSTPELPQDEVLSRLLFAKASGSLSPFQALQLAAAVAELSGGGGDGAFEKMRKALGVDSLDLSASGANGPTIGASRYLTDNVSVGVRTGAKPSDAAVNVGVDVMKKMRIQGEAGMDGHTSVGVGAEWEY
jgi:translocation and assembly module TamB